jgi:hypothetical protein
MDIYSDSKNLKRVLEKLVGEKIRFLVNVPHSGNSRSYIATVNNSLKYFVKVYYRDDKDLKRRSVVEYQSLKYLWDKGIRAIPKPVAFDKDNKIAVFEYVCGTPIDTEKLKNEDIGQVISFIKNLHSLSKGNKNGNLYSASEACFSVSEIIDNLNVRFRRLHTFAKDNKEKDLSKFLSVKFLPAFERIEKWCRSESKKRRIRFDKKLPKIYRTLSPSDFGFDNCLRRESGRIVFLDFEYFGWDDPAKMISDFLIHPKINLPDKFKRKFIEGTVPVFGRDKKLKERLEVVFPLFGLKWCFIMLNEYLPENFQRRVFAAAGPLDKKRICAAQLAKAKSMLDRIEGSYTKLPY